MTAQFPNIGASYLVLRLLEKEGPKTPLQISHSLGFNYSYIRALLPELKIKDKVTSEQVGKNVVYSFRGKKK